MTAGEQTTVAGAVGPMAAYVVGDGPRALVVLPDVWGAGLEATRVFCDTVAEYGLRVVLPDVFHGRPFSPDGPWPDMNAWWATHTRGNVLADVAQVVAGLREGRDMVGVLGFCWGGMMALECAVDGIGDRAVPVTPSQVTPSHAGQVVIPTLSLCGAADHILPRELLEPYMAAAEEAPADHAVIVWQGIGHAFVHHPAPDQAHERARAEAISRLAAFLTE